tara:strand:+ start:4713 stop:5513 length:801 start_codon:yes stop_codon:yes gene_type:complete
MFNIISLGAGVQSSTMALMAAKGEITPMPDCAIFADTGWEPGKIYNWLDWLETQLPFPVYRVNGGNIVDDLLTKKNGFTAIPFYLKDDKGKQSIGRRQCTREYKISPIRLKVRELLGLKKRQRAGKKVLARQWIGITKEESLRAKPNRDAYIENVFPLLELNMHRLDCIIWMEKNNFPKPSKSSCIGCPFKSDSHWRETKMNEKEEWEEAVRIDKLIRNPSDYGKKQAKQYMHKNCEPLDEIDFRNEEDKGQLNLFINECEGMCGV